MAGHYGVFCDVCHEPVEYADLRTHQCNTPEGTLPTSDWNYRLPEESLVQPVHAETTHVVCTTCGDSIPKATAVHNFRLDTYRCELHVPVPQGITRDERVLGRIIKRWRIER